MFEEAYLIHRYTRTDALRDGVLIDVSATAREAGFKYPVALTAAACAKCVASRSASPARTRPAGCGTCCFCYAWPSAGAKAAPARW
jgi:hypothetical protein